ncbi:uncharacterized protein LY89DRAFT_331689 [Mollisia scopiformis]|uniref:Uncharacterized protein n=1 Tax=Mollisia scopiformis TaxID=149040 RepID=A0A132B7V2_MOLSC|nr:uncharacterized protein LY89DRAFT_331689 [Mollisia scopiformis]KUJ08486.1 hypothetical protein LY89DRAFT_331689 [Mollisia scopiformis]
MRRNVQEQNECPVKPPTVQMQPIPTHRPRYAASPVPKLKKKLHPPPSPSVEMFLRTHEGKFDAKAKPRLANEVKFGKATQKSTLS